MTTISGHRKTARRKVLVGCLAAVVCACFVVGVLGVRINTSSSLPMGLYVQTSDPNASLIEFCPPEPFGSLSRDRGYRTAGFACPDRAVPLLKPVIAREGDVVEFSTAGLSVNGDLLVNTAPLRHDAAGRPLTAWTKGIYRVEHGMVWVASTYGRGSYDSRYFGPIETPRIRARLKPLWVVHR